MTITPECQRCGACCVADYETVGYAELGDDDLERLRADKSARRAVARFDPWLTTTQREMALPTKSNRQGHVVCCALVGTVDRNVRCAIYESRPEVCRDFRRGSEYCRQAIDRYRSALEEPDVD